MKNYVPLSIKSEYSSFGIIQFEELYKYLAENDIKAFAITDDDYLIGAYDLFYKKESAIYSAENEKQKRKIEEIKPILGCEINICKDFSENEETKTSFRKICLYVKNEIGYHNLVKLCSIAATEGFYYKPRITYTLLEKYKEGLICISGNSASEIGKDILNDNIEKAKEISLYYQNLFKDDFYISLSDYGLEENKKINSVLIKIAEDLDIKTVITNMAYYLRKEDADFHDIYLCALTNSKKQDKERFRLSSNNFYVKNEDEIKNPFSFMDEKDFETCINNTKEIADKCTFDFKNELNKNYTPKFCVPEGFTSETYLENLVKKGLKQRYGKNLTKEIIEQAEYELGVINKNNFADYFLIIWDIVHYAKTHNVPVGTGRGSAAGSLVNYSLKITDIDPIKFNLVFERFLNPEQINLKPDIDIDFGNREKIIKYIIKKYGKEKVSQVIWQHYHNSKSAFKTISTVLNIPIETVNEYCKLIDKANGNSIWFYKGIKFLNKKLYDENPTVLTESGEEISFQYWADIADKFILKKTGICSEHKTKIIITPCNITDIIPIESAINKGIRSVRTQYTGEALEKLGIFHFDLLDFDALNLTDKTIKLIKKDKNIKINLNKIPLDDKKVFKMLSKGDTKNVFLFDSEGMTKLVKELKPDRFDDLGALVALYRPTPLELGVTDKFIQSKNKPLYIHPILKPILETTYGEIIYQEQIDRIWNVICGYTLGKAEIIRRKLTEKNISIELKTEFMECACKKGLNYDYAEKLFGEIVETACCSFNKSHSDSYALISYQLAYLKCHYPKEYSFVSNSIRNLANLPDNSSVVISGVIGEIRRIPALKDLMKFLQVGSIKDLSGEVEFVVFDKVRKKYNSLIKPDKKVIITGMYNKRGDKAPYIIVKDIMPFNENLYKELYYKNFKS